MKNDKYKLDDFFKKKLAERQASFDVSSWEKMQGLQTPLPARDYRKLRLCLLILLFLFFTFFGGKMIWEYDTATKATQALVEQGILAEPALIEEGKGETINTFNENKNAPIKKENKDEKLKSGIKTRSKTEPFMIKHPISIFRKEEMVLNQSTQAAIVEIGIPRNEKNSQASSSNERGERLESKKGINHEKGQSALIEAERPHEKGNVLPIDTRALQLIEREQNVDLPLIEFEAKKPKLKPIYAGYLGMKNYVHETIEGYKWGLGWELGAEIAFPLNEKWNLGTGLSLYQRKKFLNTNQEIQFSEDVSANVPTQLNTALNYPSENARLLYMKWPVFASYRWKEKSSVRLGLWASYLLDVSGDLITENISGLIASSGAFNVTGSQTSTRAIRMDDISNYQRRDYGLMIGYAYAFDKHWSMMLNADLGLLSFEGDSILLGSQEDSTVFSDPTGFLGNQFSTDVKQKHQLSLNIALRYEF